MLIVAIRKKLNTVGSTPTPQRISKTIYKDKHKQKQLVRGTRVRREDSRRFAAVFLFGGGGDGASLVSTDLFFQGADVLDQIVDLIFGKFAIIRRHPVLAFADDGE